MTSGQNGNEFSFGSVPEVTGNTTYNFGASGTNDISIQESKLSDRVSGQVIINGEDNEEIGLTIRSVNCKQMAKIMEFVEKLKGIIGGQQVDFPIPPNPFPNYPYYPNHPYYPYPTWGTVQCNTNPNEINSDIQKFVAEQTLKLLKERKHDEELQRKMVDRFTQYFSDEVIDKGANKLDEDLDSIVVTDNSDKEKSHLRYDED